MKSAKISQSLQIEPVQGSMKTQRPFKFIHTGDWHLGQIFNEYDRTREHTAFFGSLKGIVAGEQPDALLVCGDIYHSSVPSASVQKLYTDAVLELKEACPDMTVVIIAGNHDSPTRLEIDRNLWEHLGVKVIGSLSKTEGEVCLEKHIVGIPSREDGMAGYVVAVPHVFRQNYPELPDGSGTTEYLPGGARQDNHQYVRQKAFYQALLDRVKSCDAEVPVVLMAHLAVSGCDASGHDDTIGGMEYTPQDVFPDGYDYLALGHIHHPQTLRRTGAASIKTGGEEVYASPVARYSGSPVAVSFDENYAHSVSVVEISGSETGDGKQVRIKQVEIPQSVPMKTIPDHPVPFEEALGALEAFPGNTKAYIRLDVLIKDYLPQNAAARAMSVAESKECRYCGMKVTRESVASPDDARRLSVEEIKAVDPVEIAGMYYRQRFGTGLDPELEEMLKEVADEEYNRREE